MTLFDALGFRWHRERIAATIIPQPVARVCARFQRQLPTFVWDAGVLEGNPLTFVEVKTLLDGVTVGGRKVSDERQILNLAAASKALLDSVKDGTFAEDKQTFCALHALIAREEALEWGHFRGEGEETHDTPSVALGEHGSYQPLPTTAGAAQLHAVFANGLAALQADVPHPFERACAFFLFGALQQFFFDGNKRASRLMMNGILLSHGLDGLSIPAASAQTFNEQMVHFYLSKNADDMMAFLASCHTNT